MAATHLVPLSFHRIFPRWRIFGGRPVAPRIPHAAACGFESGEFARRRLTLWLIGLRYQEGASRMIFLWILSILNRGSSCLDVKRELLSASESFWVQVLIISQVATHVRVEGKWSCCEKIGRLYKGFEVNGFCASDGAWACRCSEANCCIS